MRVLKMEQDEWYEYTYALTERVGWHHCVFFARAIFPMLKEAEILTAGGYGTYFEPVNVEIKTEKDILKLSEEGGALEIRGRNTVYDNCPFQFRVFNQTDAVTLLVPQVYIEELKRNETELLTEEERMHTFDKFMDHVEIMMHVLWEKACTESDMLDQIPQALCRKDNFIQNTVYGTSLTSKRLDLTGVCNKIVKNWKEVNHTKTGGAEAVAAAMNALKTADEKTSPYPNNASECIEMQNLDFCINGFGCEELEDELWNYFIKNEAAEYKGRPITRQNIINCIKPRTLIVNGSNCAHPNYGIICDCIWDEEHGISIILSGNRIRIEPDIAELA